MITYVLQMDSPEALVKFGRTTSPKARIASLSTGVPWNLRIVALIGSDVEADMKKRFSDDRVKGEWFRPTAALLDHLKAFGENGRLVRQVPVNQAYINAVLKPRIREYLAGREPANTEGGDLCCRIFADMLPTLVGREKALMAATKGLITLPLCKGFGPTEEVPHLEIPAQQSSHDIVATPTTERAA